MTGLGADALCSRSRNPRSSHAWWNLLRWVFTPMVCRLLFRICFTSVQWLRRTWWTPRQSPSPEKTRSICEYNPNFAYVFYANDFVDTVTIKFSSVLWYEHTCVLRVIVLKGQSHMKTSICENAEAWHIRVLKCDVLIWQTFPFEPLNLFMRYTHSCCKNMCKIALMKVRIEVLNNPILKALNKRV